jgi:hypothetical protein
MVVPQLGDTVMPVLPLIDLMLLSGWTALSIGFVLKVVAMTTHYRPSIASLTPTDFLMIGGAAMLFSIALAARTWVASQGPAQTSIRRRDETMRAYRELRGDWPGEDAGESSQSADSVASDENAG